MSKSRLQFGHGDDAVENNDSPSHLDTSDIKSLQFGHGFTAVENKEGEVWYVGGDGDELNSATAVMPWKTSSPDR